MTETEICNLALSQIGAARLTDWAADTTESAVQCRLWYELVRDELMEDFDWSFARKHMALSAISAESFTNWTYVYAFPGDCLKARLIENSVDNAKILFEVRAKVNTIGSCIVCNEASPTLVYTEKVTNTTAYPSAFIRALGLKLAASIAYPLRNDLQLQQQVEALSTFALSKAQLSDVKEGVVQVDDTSGIIDSRS